MPRLIAANLTPQRFEELKRQPGQVAPELDALGITLNADGAYLTQASKDEAPAPTPWYELWLPAPEVETEWREVPLRFTEDVNPAPGQKGSANNSIKTSKYTVLNWIPKGTFEQFRRVANVYFLIISLMMIIGTYSSLYENSIQYATTLGPLVIIIGFTLVKEGLEDKKRHESDAEVNGRKAEVVVGRGSSGGEVATKLVEWRFLQPGMVVKVKDREEFPADVVCLASADPEGKCYIETANIDGETNLKLRKCASCSKDGAGPGWKDASGLVSGAAGGEKPSLSFEPPNPSIHTFAGTVTTAGGVRAGCGASELCLRGAVLRNTKWVLAAVVYTGSDTKLVMNSRAVPSKLSTIESTVNKMIYFILLADVLLTTATTICRAVWNADYQGEQWYLCYGAGKPVLFTEGCDGSGGEYASASYWATFFILYNNFLPLSLYVTLEVVNFVQAYYVDQDREMYDPVSDTPALARTSNQNGDLGQIEYIFSDKTGTLTCNEMKFRRTSSAGKVFGDAVVSTGAPGAPLADLASAAAVGAQKGARDDAANNGSGSSAALKMAELLATCHNVVVEKDEKTGAATYQAESPDEEALVEGGKVLGYTFLGATSDTLTVGHAGGTRTYKLLATIPFTSSRKRMSVMLVTPEGQHRLYCKGADNVMFDRAGSYEECGGHAAIDAHLEGFSNEGLRTLVLAYRDFDAADATAWAAKWAHGLTLADREAACEANAAVVESQLRVVGATAIEDRLQDGVPECIADLKEAGIKVWVLTGDKMTTAINIGFSCRLLTTDMELITLDKEQPGDGQAPVLTRLKACYDQYSTLAQHPTVIAQFRRKALRFEQSLCAALGCTDPASVRAAGGRSFDGGAAGVRLQELDTDHLALIVDGPSLLEILAHGPSKEMLLQVGCFCKAVIACRVSPAQKQLIVKMVKEGLPHKPITLSIGDGANDVPMIQEAQIGVGISGKEGRQAVNSSDFAIAQFRFVKRLLLVHGRFNYRRTSKVIIYSFYKNIVLVIVLFCFACYSGFSGQSLYGANSWCYSGYNFFLGLPPFMLGFFDKDVEAATAMAVHKLYFVGLNNMDLNVAKMLEGFASALVDALLVFFVAYASLQGGGHGWQADGTSVGLNTFGNAVFGVMVFAMLGRICLLFTSWNSWSAFSVAFSVAFYLAFVAAYESLGNSGSFDWEVGEYDFWGIPGHLFSVPGFWLTLVLICGSSCGLGLALKALRTELWPTRDVVAAEFERAVAKEGLTPAEVRDRLHGGKAAAALNGGGGGEGGGSDDIFPAQVKVDPSVMQAFHLSQTPEDKQAAGLMKDKAQRSSFIDNTPSAGSHHAGPVGAVCADKPSLRNKAPPKIKGSGGSKF